MSDGRNLWIGALLGMLLTGGLMFALYQQSGLAGAAHKAAEKVVVVPPEASAVFVPVEPDAMRLETPTQTSVSRELPAKVVKRQTGLSGEVKSVDKIEVDKAEIVSGDSALLAGVGVLGEDSVPSADLIDALPEELDLSPAELSEMSAVEREQYDKMLRSYREVRAQVLKLDQESAALQQRMDSMFEQNDAMEREIKRMRALLQQLPEKNK